MKFLKNFFIVFFLCVPFCMANEELKTISETNSDRFVNTVILKVLNKITGKSFEVVVKVGEVATFDKLEILPLKCWKSYPEEEPENKLLLKVFEQKKDKKEEVFYGWMFSSTPSISGLENPLYDVVLKECYQQQEIIENVANN